LGLGAEEYRNDQSGDDSYSGIAEIDIDEEEMSALWEEERLDEVSAVEDLTTGTGLILNSARGAALGRAERGGALRLVRGDREVVGVHGRSAEQRLAIDLLLDPAVGIVSLGGRAGTGKSALALAAGLEAVLERQQHRKVMVFRPLYAVGGQELGYLPG